MSPTRSEREQVFFQYGANSGEGGYYFFDTRTNELVLNTGERRCVSTAGQFNENKWTSSSTGTPSFSKPDTTL
jgi:hypothetical protein